MKFTPTLFLKLTTFVLGGLVLIFLLLWLPVQLNQLTASYLEDIARYYPIPVLVGIYLSAIPFFIALFNAYRLVHYIEQQQAFSEAAVKALTRIKHCALFIICLYVIGVIWLGLLGVLFKTVAVFAITIVFVTLVLIFFASVLQELLRHALAIKAENELTI
ncbi:Protein of unknown function [Amphibacillus marinus]|uniref:DUF2975 domain-containing protein n=1 Tax=Amphibacillus marinus TaxID=872970 RepID=A0A1H8QZS3_9BACI|nr:DUF2975 domain-containing protein [Amphibacillus marinus]SEO59507.1 Protein of unknown function [Amphibacillus marinus]